MFANLGGQLTATGKWSRLNRQKVNPNVFMQKALTQLFLYVLITPLSAWALSAHGADAALVSGNNLDITGVDIIAETSRLPPDTRKTVLAKPTSVNQIAQTLFVRRALAAEADGAGITQNPTVAAAVQIAKEAALAEAMLAKIDLVNTPTDAALEKFSLSKYRANPGAFTSAAEVNVSHILIKTPAADAEKRAVALLRDLKQGADFASLARKHSEDAGSAARDGNLGAFQRGKMVPAFEDAAFSLSKPGELSGVVKTEFGFHILKLVSKTEAAIRPFEEVGEQIGKDVLATLLAEGRRRETVRILKDAKFDQQAIEAFAANPK
jgi:peptidyl-prolyl cis-trans isomerase C